MAVLTVLTACESEITETPRSSLVFNSKKKEQPQQTQKTQTPESNNNNNEENATNTTLIELDEDFQHFSNRIHPILSRLSNSLVSNLNSFSEKDLKEMLFLAPSVPNLDELFSNAQKQMLIRGSSTLNLS